MQTERKSQPFVFADTKPHVLIVEGRFYDAINDSLIEGARRVLERAGATYEICSVPGALEIPTAIRLAMKTDLFEGFIALGCVIKGSTHHDQIVGTESARSLQVLGIKRGLAIGNGILTCNTLEQAVERADPAQMDRGGAAAEACLRLIEIKRQWRKVKESDHENHETCHKKEGCHPKKDGCHHEKHESCVTQGAERACCHGEQAKHGCCCHGEQAKHGCCCHGEQAKHGCCGGHGRHHHHHHHGHQQHTKNGCCGSHGHARHGC